MGNASLYMTGVLVGLVGVVSEYPVLNAIGKKETKPPYELAISQQLSERTNRSVVQSCSGSNTLPNSHFYPFPAITSIEDIETTRFHKSGAAWLACTYGFSRGRVAGVSQCDSTVSGNIPVDGKVSIHDLEANLAQFNSPFRLPSLRELKSIVDRSCKNPATNLSVFPDTRSAGYWAKQGVDYYIVDFADGTHRKANPSERHFARLIHTNKKYEDLRSGVQRRTDETMLMLKKPATPEWGD